MDIKNSRDLKKLIAFVINAHFFYARKHDMRVRRWDKKTPYSIHPIWCGMTIQAEQKLSVKTRNIGAQALFLHDIKEDTKEKLPKYIGEEVRELVQEMTFKSINQEMREIWSKNDLVILLKLYDKVSNLLDYFSHVPGREKVHCNYVTKLADFVEGRFGNLNIVVMARAIVKNKVKNLKQTKRRVR